MPALDDSVVEVIQKQEVWLRCKTGNEYAAGSEKRYHWRDHPIPEGRIIARFDR